MSPLAAFLTIAALIVVVLAYRGRTRADRQAAMGDALGAVSVGFISLVTGLFGVQAFFSSFRAEDEFRIGELAVGLIAVGAALLGLGCGLAIYRQPSVGRGFGLLAADKVAAVIIGLVALVSGTTGAQAMLFGCSTRGEMCGLGVLAGTFVLVVGLIGLGLSIAIWKQPKIGRPMGLLASAVVAGLFVRLTVASIATGSNLGFAVPGAAISLALVAAFVLFTYSTVKWLRSTPVVE